MEKFYTGTGSKTAPWEVLLLMYHLAQRLAAAGYWLRTGMVTNPNRAFRQGAGSRHVVCGPEGVTTGAMMLAETYHPTWDRCDGRARKFHACGVHQVLGQELDRPSEFVVVWTADGCTTHAERTVRTGAPATAISIADSYAIPVFNLRRKDHRRLVRDLWIKEGAHA